MLCTLAPSSGLAQASPAQLSSETSIEQKEPLQHRSMVCINKPWQRRLHGQCLGGGDGGGAVPQSGPKL